MIAVKDITVPAGSMIRFGRAFAIALLTFSVSLPFPASAQQVSYPQRSGMSSGQADAILQELREIQRLLESAPAEEAKPGG